MPKFQYKARDERGKSISGYLEAADEKSAASRLAEHGFYVASISEARREPLLKTIINRFRRINKKELIGFSRKLATMVHAGLPILTAVDILIIQTNSKTFKNVLEEVRIDLSTGSTLTESLSKHPNIFSRLYVSTVRVGEETGNLETVLNRLAYFTEWELNLSSSVKGSMMYPIVVLIVATGVAFFLFFHVLPKFRDVYARANVKLPMITRILFNISAFVVNNWQIILGAVILLLSFLIFWSKKPKGKRMFDFIFLRIPIIRKMLMKIYMLRFARSLEIMTRSNVGIIQALGILQDTIGNSYYRDEIERIGEEVQQGKSIGMSLRETNKFDKMLVEMISVGEETGALDDMLSFVSDDYEKEIDYMSKNLPKVIEPILLVFLSAMVVVIALSLFLPIFRLIDVIQKVK
ncbi:MAG: type II secretion system F family protein [Planctomycetota bacterium]